MATQVSLGWCFKPPPRKQDMLGKCFHRLSRQELWIKAPDKWLNKRLNVTVSLTEYCDPTAIYFLQPSSSLSIPECPIRYVWTCGVCYKVGVGAYVMYPTAKLVPHPCQKQPPLCFLFGQLTLTGSAVISHLVAVSPLAKPSLQALKREENTHNTYQVYPELCPLSLSSVTCLLLVNNSECVAGCWTLGPQAGVCHTPIGKCTPCLNKHLKLYVSN